MTCERCHSRRARYAALDEPEQEGAALGDELLAMCLCARCLRESEADGERSAVYRLEPA